MEYPCLYGSKILIIPRPISISILSPSFNLGGGLMTILSPAFTPSRTSTISPILLPRVIFVSATRLSARITKTFFWLLLLITAAGLRTDHECVGTDEMLEKLDIVTAAVHSAMNQSQEQMTKRIIKAIENPNVDVIAHPTSRLLPDREPVAIDMEAIFQAAAKNNTRLEINAMPSRLDLKDIHAYRARELGVKLVIDTDAHRTDHLRFMRFGIGVARRGWCQAPDILNSRPVEEVLTYLASRG